MSFRKGLVVSERLIDDPTLTIPEDVISSLAELREVLTAALALAAPGTLLYRRDHRRAGRRHPLPQGDEPRPGRAARRGPPAAGGGPLPRRGRGGAGW